MLICKTCKAEMPDDTYFCEKCGEMMHDQNNDADSLAALDNSIASVEENANKFCFSCGAKLGIEPKFCPSCGKPQSLPPVMPPIGSNTNTSPPPADPASVTFTKTTAPESSSPTPPRLSNAAPSRKLLGEFSVSVCDSSILNLKVGKLTVYSDRIVFKPMLNVFGNVIVIQIDEIVSVNATTVSVALIPSGVVQIILRSGEGHMFIPIIWEKDRLIKLLQDQIR